MARDDLVVVTEHLVDEALRWLSERCRVERCAPDVPEFPGLLADAAGLVVRTYTTVDAALLRGAPKLRVVGRAGVGLDNIDLDACRARSIKVVYTPDANTQAVVEYVFTLLLDALRPRCIIDAELSGEQWSGVRAGHVGRELANQCFGVLGFGRIGRRVASVAGAFGCRVIYCDLLDIPPEQRCGATPVDVQQLFARADIITIHIDGRPSNRHVIDRPLLEAMSDQVVFLNTSRGFVVDGAALAEAMRRRLDALALLDVHEREPVPANDPLFGLPNVRLYPHLASRTNRGMANMSGVVRDVAAVLEGDEPKHPAP